MMEGVVDRSAYRRGGLFIKLTLSVWQLYKCRYNSANALDIISKLHSRSAQEPHLDTDNPRSKSSSATLAVVVLASLTSVSSRRFPSGSSASLRRPR